MKRVNNISERLDHDSFQAIEPRRPMHLLSAAPRLLALCALTVSSVAACDTDPGEASEPAAPAELLVTPEMHLLAPVEIVPVPEDYEFHPTIADDEPLERDPLLSRHEGDADGRFGVIYVDYEESAEYIASYDGAAVKAAADELMRLGFADGSPDPDADSFITPRGWSNDIDNRISLESYAVTNPTLRRVGKVGGGCTGALFGNRMVLTAAHCIFDENGDYHANHTFQARRNGADAPYGTVTSQGAVYPISFKNDGCNLTYTGACVKNDWAILVLPPNPWATSPNGAPGWFGIAWASDATVAGWDTHNIGYPVCSKSMAPAACVNNVAYGDLSCAGVDPAMSDPDSRWPLYGTNGKMRAGCDTSPGHSGGPIYSYNPGVNGPYLIGNTVWNQCNSSTCDVFTQYSSAGIRISETLFDYMINLRAQYP